LASSAETSPPFCELLDLGWLLEEGVLFEDFAVELEDLTALEDLGCWDWLLAGVEPMLSQFLPLGS
jgi:hypothetical protein